MKPFQTFRDGKKIFFLPGTLLGLHQMWGLVPSGEQALPFDGDPLRPRGGTVGFSASEPQLSTSSATGMSWANGSFAFAVDLCSGCSKNLLMVAGLKSLD